MRRWQLNALMFTLMPVAMALFALSGVAMLVFVGNLLFANWGAALTWLGIAAAAAPTSLAVSWVGLACEDKLEAIDAAAKYDPLAEMYGTLDRIAELCSLDSVVQSLPESIRDEFAEGAAASQSCQGLTPGPGGIHRWYMTGYPDKRWVCQSCKVTTVNRTLAEADRDRLRAATGIVLVSSIKPRRHP